MRIGSVCVTNECDRVESRPRFTVDELFEMRALRSPMLHLIIVDADGRYTTFADLSDDDALGDKLTEADDLGRIGTCIYWSGEDWDGDDDHDAVGLLRFWIDKPWQGRGFGTGLLQQMERDARQRVGVARIELTLPAYRPDLARRFYEKNGYEFENGGMRKQLC